MSWWTQTFWCEACEREIKDIFPKTELPETIPCECGETMIQIVSCNQKPQLRHHGERRVNNIGNRKLYHQQSGIYYSSYKELEQKAAAKGMFPIGNRQESIDWIESADTESYEMQQKKKRVKEYRDECARNGIDPGGEITKEVRDSLRKRNG
jgi:hypothetical protein